MVCLRYSPAHAVQRERVGGVDRATVSSCRRNVSECALLFLSTPDRFRSGVAAYARKGAALARAKLRSREILKWVMQYPARGRPYTIREAAEEAGLRHHSALGHLLTGERQQVAVDDAHRIAEVAGCGVQTLFELATSTSRDETSRENTPT